MKNHTHIKTYLTLLRAGNYDLALKLNEEWTIWLIKYLDPLSPPIEKNQIPFYSIVYELTFSDVYTNIISKQNIFNIDLTKLRKNNIICLWEQTNKPEYHSIYYKIADKDYELVIYHKKDYNNISCNIALDTKLEAFLRQNKNFPNRMYALGVRESGLRIRWLMLINETEFGYKMLEDKLYIRMADSRSFFQDKGLNTIDEGLYITTRKQLSEGIYIFGDNLHNIKEIKI
jgi:hypothetical protein